MNDMPKIKTLAATRSWGRGRVYDNITETIGQTPLVWVCRRARLTSTVLWSTGQ